MLQIITATVIPVFITTATLIKNKSPEYCLEIINGVDKIK
jgi:hypothetical protein